MHRPSTPRDECGDEFEREARAAGFQRIAGADEAGRGSLFGPVYAAAVILPPGDPVPGVQDSKKLTPARREELAARIQECALAWAVGTSDVQEIDRINIYQASRLAMRRAVEALRPAPDFLLADALHVDYPVEQRALIKGDARCRSIAAASILAKVHRDACMREWDARYPQYGLARHKGYATAAHLEALGRLGPTPHHRMTFAPVRILTGHVQLELMPCASSASGQCV